MTVTFARESENRVWPRIYFAGDASSEVHAQKWEARIGHGVDQRSHQRGALGDKIVIFAPERHDEHARIIPSHAGDAVAVKSGTVDKGRSGERSARSFDDDLVRESTDSGRGC